MAKPPTHAHKGKDKGVRKFPHAHMLQYKRCSARVVQLFRGATLAFGLWFQKNKALLDLTLPDSSAAKHWT